MKHRKLFHLDRLGLFHKHYTSLLLTGSNTLAYSSTVSVTNKKGLTRLTRVLLWGGKTERKKNTSPSQNFWTTAFLKFFRLLSNVMLQRLSYLKLSFANISRVKKHHLHWKFYPVFHGKNATDSWNSFPWLESLDISRVFERFCSIFWQKCKQ